MYPVWSHIQQQVLAFEEILSFQIHAKSETLKRICIVSPISEAICNNWLVRWLFSSKYRIQISSKLRILEHKKIQTENQVNPVVVNCWMRNWNGGIVMCALVHNESPHSQKKTQFVLVNLLYFFASLAHLSIL